MISFYLNIIKLSHAIISGLKNDEEFRVLFFLLLTILVGSTVFYSGSEKWSLIDSLYFSVMTMSTIGYGDLYPTTVISKVFTVIFIFISIGLFVAINTKIVILMLKQKKKIFIKSREGY
ncbi:potassium channel family protein [Vibrio genomosp. F10]|uniref:potassium channel family protein n=1 Tax=Vibrio genomosp. F10 TaxID=723171 RepID=UPI00037CD5C6|nr:hypothetical protein A1QI_09535 [Vibrio genomosp. F10 str. 9ZB36]